jgi:hypothetical protein
MTPGSVEIISEHKEVCSYLVFFSVARSHPVFIWFAGSFEEWPLSLY